MQAVIPVALMDMQGHTHDVHTLFFCVCRLKGHRLNNRVNAQKQFWGVQVTSFVFGKGQKKLLCVFVDLENAYDGVPGDELRYKEVRWMSFGSNLWQKDSSRDV